MTDTLAPSVVNPPDKASMFGNLKGFFPCKRCKVCKTSKTLSFSSQVTSKVYKISDFLTCGTVGVVYLLKCPCGLQYVGRTTRALNIRIGEHLSNIRRGFLRHSIYKHFSLHHHRDPSLLEVISIERYTPHWRGVVTSKDIISRMGNERDI